MGSDTKLGSQIPMAKTSQNAAALEEIKNIIQQQAGLLAKDHVGNSVPGAPSPPSPTLLESMIMQTVKPLVKNWLDDNLERIVTEIVAEEARKRLNDD